MDDLLPTARACGGGAADIASFPPSPEDKLEDVMLSWVVRLLLIVGGAVTGLFIAEDAPNFGIIRTMVALILVTLFVLVGAFWPAGWRFKRSNGDSGH